VIAEHATAQFDPVTLATNIQEQLGGELLSSEGAPVPEPGDQIAAMFGDLAIGVFTFTSTQTDPLAWDMIIFGNDPDTQNVKEGPGDRDRLTFRFFDASTNTTRLDVAAINADDEIITVLFEGDEALQFDFNFPGAPPFNLIPGPAIPFDLILGVMAPEPSPDEGGSDGDGGGNPDVNGDGRVDKRDAALVLRIVVGATRIVSEAEARRADVNGDGVVSTADAIAILSRR